MCNINTKEKRKVYLFSFITMFILMMIFLNSCFFPYAEFSKRKLLVGIIVTFGIVVVPVLIIKVKKLYESILCIIKYLVDMGKELYKEKKRIVFFLCIGIGVGGMSWVGAYVISKYILHTLYNPYVFYTFLTIGGIGGTLLFWGKQAATKVHVIFSIVAFILGIFCIGVTPNRVGVSWDDEVHYQNTLELANVFSGIMYQADEKNILEYGNNIYGRTGYDRQTDKEYTEQLEELYESKEWSAHHFSKYGVWSVAYIPSAIGIILGRGIGLPYVGVFNMGRLFNLTFYILLISLSIKKMKYAKVLVATIGLIPTMIFMASSYSYDPWVVGFLVLGFSYFFSELQEKETIKNRNIVIMLASFTLGCMPKAIYFPLLLPLLFMPKRKFVSTSQRKYYYLAIFSICFVLVASFILPILISGAGTGDVRGGADVNSAEQIKFILNNPLAYAKILLKFEIDYIALSNTAPMLQKFAYVGDGYFYSVISLMLAILAFLDRDENEQYYNIVRIAGVGGNIIAIILSTTALYVSFNAVGLGTVLGMQPRYLIPTIFPSLFIIGGGRVSHKINKNLFVCVPMLIVSLTFIANMYKLCVLCY